MKLTNVSKTAMNTLIMRVAESENKSPKLNDPMAVELLDWFMRKASVEEIKWISEWKNRYASLFSGNRKAEIRRVNRIDEIANNFISKNPLCTVINLGCGIDTWFWRINYGECRYIELDLPEVIEVKRELFGEKITYELIGCSVIRSCLDW